MKTKKLILSSLLLAIGFILRHLVPGVIGGMKFDLMLVFIFISIMINPSFKNVILTSLIGGILTAITTTFPGGQIPNIIDKFITGLTIYIMIKLISINSFSYINAILLGFFGTIVSGSVFLFSALLIVGLPVPFNVLFLTIVVPTSIINSILTVSIYQIVKKCIKLTNVSFV